MGNQLGTRRGWVTQVTRRQGKNVLVIEPYPVEGRRKLATFEAFIVSTPAIFRVGDNVVARQNGVNWEV